MRIPKRQSHDKYITLQEYQRDSHMIETLHHVPEHDIENPQFLTF